MHSSPLLAVDAGNSRVKFGLFEAVRTQSVSMAGGSSAATGVWPECRQFLAVPVGDSIPWDVLSRWKSGDGQAVIAGSNPVAVESLLKDWRRSGWEAPAVLRQGATLPLATDVDFPEKVGLDRLLNAIAVNALRPAHRAAIIIDSGTATTVDYVSQTGVFCGGSILPGLELSAKALHHYTSLLPLLPVQDIGATPPNVPGRNTRDAMRAGLFWGQVGAIRELIRQICLQRNHSLPKVLASVVSGVPIDQESQDCPSSSDVPCPWLILTGGGAHVLSPQFPGVPRLASLGMHGLVLTQWQAVEQQPMSSVPSAKSRSQKRGAS